MRNYMLRLLVCITLLSSMSVINCMDRNDQYGTIQVSQANNTIIAIAHLANSKWQTKVTKNVTNGAFTTESTMVLNTRNLRTTPVMPHPPLIKVLKMEITKFELA